jgi:hypothetical protein
LPDQIDGREVGQNQGGDQQGTEDGFCAIQGEISSHANQGQDGSNDALDWKLQQFNRADSGSTYPKGDQFAPDRDPAVAEQGITESHVHDKRTCTLLKKEQGHWKAVDGKAVGPGLTA